MEPPTPPAQKPRLGAVFWAILLAPLLMEGVIMAARPAGISEVTGYVMLVSAIPALICGIQFAIVSSHLLVGRIFIGLVSFVLLQVFYIVALMAGCSAVSGPMNMH